MSRTYIIAEAGVNHNGSLDMARQLVDQAARAGADAVKFQTFKAEKIAVNSAPKAQYQIKTTDNAETQMDMLKKLELDFAAHQILFDYCQTRGIEFLSTPFDHESAGLLINDLNLPRIKISSGDITNAPLLLEIAVAGKAIILSTGMSTIEEIKEALSVIAFGYLNLGLKPSLYEFEQAYNSEAGQRALQEKVTILHCTTEYPAPFEDVHLRAISQIHNAFGLPVGYSDHTAGIAVSIAAVALGATVIEKHFTLDRKLPGPDHAASLEPNELTDLVSSIRQVEVALGKAEKKPTFSELKNRPVARKSLVAGNIIRKGELFTSENIEVKRPGMGVSPMMYWDYVGRTALKDYDRDEVISQ